MQIIKGELKNNENLEFGDINIFVGPNGVGKTTLMNEIRGFFCQGNLSTSYWITDLENSNLEPKSASILLRYTKEEIETNDHGEEIRKYIISHNKNNTGGYESHDSSNVYSEEIHDKLVALSRSKKCDIEKIQLPNYRFSYKIFIGYEGTKQRLSLEGIKKITDTKNPPNDVINFILQKKEFQNNLSEAFLRCFKHYLFFSEHRKENVEILVGKKNHKENITKFNDYSEIEKFKKDNKILTIDKVGDGMRAGAKLFFSLFNPDSQIIFIDEPEVFIHPKQKINIARELKNLAKENKKQLFLSTHDATFLSGLIDDKEDKISVKIFYLKDHQKIISLKNFSVSDEKITPSTKNPKYIQSLFHDGTIFTESPNDRCFYENTIERIFKKELSQKDIVFTELSGVSRALEVAQFVKDSEIEAAFIFDRDVISRKKGNEQKLPEIYKNLGGEKNLEKMLSKLPNNKEGVIRELEKYGVFIVPNGELESWNADGIKKGSIGFPYNIIEEMIDNPTDDFTSFVKKILNFLIKEDLNEHTKN